MTSIRRGGKLSTRWPTLKIHLGDSAPSIAHGALGKQLWLKSDMNLRLRRSRSGGDACRVRLDADLVDLDAGRLAERLNERVYA
jgi:hypothetical protein